MLADAKADPAPGIELRLCRHQARCLLDSAGWEQRDAEGYRVKNGRRLAAELLTYETGAYPSSIAVAIQADLKKVGFQLTIDIAPLPLILEKRYAGNFQVIAAGYWHTNTPDGLYILYHSKSISTPSFIGQNIGSFRDEPLDVALSAARHSVFRGLAAAARCRWLVGSRPFSGQPESPRQCCWGWSSRP